MRKKITRKQTAYSLSLLTIAGFFYKLNVNDRFMLTIFFAR